MYYTMTFSEQSCSLTKSIPKDEKKNNGIYFTPLSTIEKNLKILKQMGTEVRKNTEKSDFFLHRVNFFAKSSENVRLFFCIGK